MQSCGMAAAASSDRVEVDTSRAFRSVKEAVALFGDRILSKEIQFRAGSVVRERSSWRDAVAIAASNRKLEGSDGVSHSDLLVRESPSKPNAIANVKHSRSSSKPGANLMPVSDATSMCLVPSSPPFFASSPLRAHGDEEQDCKEANLMVMSSIKKVEEETAKTRQEAVQLKKRLSELELAMANLNAKLHRALSKLAHMEADKAAAARASIQQRDGNMAALTVWAEPERQAPRHPLGHLLSLDEDDGEEVIIHDQRRMTTTMRKRKVPKQKPIVPLVVPLINGMLFSNNKRMKDKESIYMKELYSLLRLT